MKKLLLVRWFSYVLVILIACMIVPVLAGAQETDVLPPSVTPVVILAGSDYEMGFQYGQQAGQYMEKRKIIEWGTFARWGFTHEDVISELKAAQYFIKKDAPEQIEWMQGIADGAKDAGYDLSYTDILLLNAAWIVRKPGSNATAPYPPAANDEKLDENCSVWAAWGGSTTDGKLVFGYNDDMGVFDYGVVVVAFPDEGNAYLTTCRPGELSQTPLMNNKGVIIACSTGPTMRPEDKDYGIPWPNARQHAIRNANTAQEVKDIVLKMTVASGLNLTIADTSNDAYVLEVTSATNAIRKPGDFGESEFIYATNNYFTEEMKASNKGEEVPFIEHAGFSRGSSVTRNLLLWNMLNNYKGNVDVEFAKMITRFPGNPPPSAPWEGWKTVPGNYGNERVTVMKPSELLFYLCTGTAARPVYPFTPSSSGCFPIAPTHTFYELKLAVSPEAVAEAAGETALYDIGMAFQKLREKMNLTDPGYTGLSDILSQATAEYFEGFNALNEGSMIGSGNEALSAFGKATTLFANAQAHALQVYEALVPPPTSPDKMGLKPWGSWEK
ncbi:MAG: C45 family autoproteolytic acyltransferase/hydrolase [candidate division Zixibacteria bacterium]|nr:C45 family autoproteolytic acyltransferase/hydrolase [candidate division Zixibacteria bacterium]